MKSKFFPECFYRVTVKGLLVKDGKLLLSLESPELSGQWELPGGGLDFGETPEGALKREVKEEMGLKVTHVSKQPLYTWLTKYENKRDLDWYISLTLAYKMETADLDFKKTAECQDIGFFLASDLQTLDLHRQSLELRKVFKPEDFL